MIGSADDSRNDDFFHFLSDWFERPFGIIGLNEFSELFLGPHAFFKAVFKLSLGEIFVVLLNGVVSEMGKLVGDFGLIVVFNTEATIELSIHPYFRRIVVFNQDPLSYVEFFLLDNQWVFNVFLHHILRLLA